jgi:hypothetical protein
MEMEDKVNESPYVDVSMVFQEVRAQGRKLRWLADATGVSLSYVSKMQNGERPARREWAERAAAVLGLPSSLFLQPLSRQLDEISSIDGRPAAD